MILSLSVCNYYLLTKLKIIHMRKSRTLHRIYARLSMCKILRPNPKYHCMYITRFYETSPMLVTACAGKRLLRDWSLTMGRFGGGGGFKKVFDPRFSHLYLPPPSR